MDENEVKLMNDLSGVEYKLFSFIRIWRGKRLHMLPDHQYTYEKIGMPRATYFKAMRTLKEKGVISK